MNVLQLFLPSQSNPDSSGSWRYASVLRPDVSLALALPVRRPRLARFGRRTAFVAYLPRPAAQEVALDAVVHPARRGARAG